MELKLERPCPWCGTPNGPSAARCLGCTRDLDPVPTAVRPHPPVGTLEAIHATAHCPACGQPNLPGVERCIDCGEALPAVAGAVNAPPRGAIRTRPRPKRRITTMKDAFAFVKLAWLMRLGAVAFLLWGLWDTSTWLNKVTVGLAPGDPAALRCNVFAIFEVVRDIGVVLGVWLLTLLTPRQPL